MGNDDVEGYCGTARKSVVAIPESVIMLSSVH